MSADENTIPFPVDKLKSETLRLVAKDLGVGAGGKKTELLERLRASSMSGWETPIKRKVEAPATDTPPTRTKKARAPATAPRATRSTKKAEIPASTTRSGRRRSHALSRVKKDRPQQDAPAEEEPQVEVNDDSEPKRHIFDDYLVSGSTNVFITADDLLAMVGEHPSPTALALWKSTSAFSQRDRTPAERVDHWLIPSDQEDKIQNVAAFQDAYKDILEKERKLKEDGVKGEKPQNGVSKKKGKTEAVEEAKKKPSKKPSWYKVTISRNLGKGALAVKLVKGTVEDKRIVLVEDADEEEGSFWLSEPVPAGQDDSNSLDHVVGLLF